MAVTVAKPGFVGKRGYERTDVGITQGVQDNDTVKADDDILEPDEVIPAGASANGGPSTDPDGRGTPEDRANPGDRRAPEGRLHPDDVKVPAHVEALAWVLDDWIRIPVINRRVGLDGAIGMIPGVGDGVGLVASAIIILSAVQQGVSVPTVVRMMGNVLFDSLVGVVPFAGDAFDFMWKSNAKNVRLLRSDLVEPRRTRRSSLTVIAISVAVVLTLTAVAVAAAALSVWLMVSVVRAIF